MNLYLYCSSRTLLEFFTLNKIVCKDYLLRKTRKVIPSLGLISDKFLFLTPKKLQSAVRSFGFDQDIVEIPVILELSISESDAANWPVLAVDQEGKIAKSFSNLSDISETYMGVFVKAEISFSFVSHIIFNNDVDKEDIYRPSSDLYFPEHLYDIVDDSFAESLNTDVVSKLAERLNKNYAKMDVCSIISKRTKVTSIVLNTILETKEWCFGKKHIANFDSNTMNLLNKQEELKKLINNEKEKKKDSIISQNSIFSKKKRKSKKLEVAFFEELIIELISLSSTTFSQSDFQAVIKNVLNKVANIDSEEQRDFFAKRIKDIEELVYGLAKDSLETKLKSMKYSVLKALIFFLRSSKSGKKLADGLNVYKAEPDVHRYAWIMFAALNGIEPISSDKKCYREVMNIAEEIAMKKHSGKKTKIVSVVSSDSIIENKFVPEVKCNDSSRGVL